MNVRERMRPEAMAANSSYTIRSGAGMGGFLCTVAGNLTITDADGTVLVSALPLTAGLFHEIRINFKTSQGATIQLAGGAAGTLCV